MVCFFIEAKIHFHFLFEMQRLERGKRKGEERGGREGRLEEDEDKEEEKERRWGWGERMNLSSLNAHTRAVSG